MPNNDIEVLSLLVSQVKKISNHLTPDSTNNKLFINDIKNALKDNVKSISEEFSISQKADNKSLSKLYEYIQNIEKKSISMSDKILEMENQKKKETEDGIPLTKKDKNPLTSLLDVSFRKLNHNLGNLLFFVQDELYDLKVLNSKTKIEKFDKNGNNISDNLSEEFNEKLTIFGNSVFEKISQMNEQGDLMSKLIKWGLIGTASIPIITLFWKNRNQIYDMLLEFTGKDINPDSIQKTINKQQEENKQYMEKKKNGNLSESDYTKEFVKDQFKRPTEKYSIRLTNMLPGFKDIDENLQNMLKQYITIKLLNFQDELYIGFKKGELDNSKIKSIKEKHKKDIIDELPRQSWFKTIPKLLKDFIFGGGGMGVAGDGSGIFSGKLQTKSFSDNIDFLMEEIIAELQNNYKEYEKVESNSFQNLTNINMQKTYEEFTSKNGRKFEKYSPEKSKTSTGYDFDYELWIKHITVLLPSWIKGFISGGNDFQERESYFKKNIYDAYMISINLGETDYNRLYKNYVLPLLKDYNQQYEVSKEITFFKFNDNITKESDKYFNSIFSFERENQKISLGSSNTSILNYSENKDVRTFYDTQVENSPYIKQADYMRQLFFTWINSKTSDVAKLKKSDLQKYKESLTDEFNMWIEETIKQLNSLWKVDISNDTFLSNVILEIKENFKLFISSLQSDNKDNIQEGLNQIQIDKKKSDEEYTKESDKVDLNLNSSVSDKNPDIKIESPQIKEYDVSNSRPISKADLSSEGDATLQDGNFNLINKKATNVPNENINAKGKLNTRVKNIIFNTNMKNKSKTVSNEKPPMIQNKKIVTNNISSKKVIGNIDFRGEMPEFII